MNIFNRNDVLSEQDPIEKMSCRFGGFYSLKYKHCLSFIDFKLRTVF